jgi:Flp pilus assembly protein TadB
VLSPTMTVFVLAVLWLIVVAPMVVRRNDERRRDRSIDGFGRAMRALGRRPKAGEGTRQEVFVPMTSPTQVAQAPSVPARRPVPAAQEALMFPVDRSDMSASRAQMMARRRRSLTILGAGTVLFLPIALFVGGMTWLAALPFTLGLAGYLYFLRSQAVRDRSRRAHRQERARSTRSSGVDATDETMEFPLAAPTVVRIDDDDIELQNLETIDLTGLYTEELTQTADRRAS